MADLPIAIKRTLRKLRSKSTHYLSIKKIRGHYYVFEVMSKWSSEIKKSKTLTNYLGTIKENGTFVPVKHRNVRAENSSMGFAYDKHEEVILRNLSMNGRMPVPMLANRVGLSNTATRYQVKKLEDKYGITYITPLDPTVYGYTTYISFIKFKSKVPTSEEIKHALEPEERIQLVLLTKGQFDIVIVLLATDNRDVTYLVNRLKTATIFKNYESEWYVSPRYNIYGIVPIRQQFFDLLEKQVWKRAKDFPRPVKGNLSSREFWVLKELNNNGNIDFIDIDKKYYFREGTSQYVYHKLIDKGAISRVTITMAKPPLKYNAIVEMKIINGAEFDRTRVKIFEEIIKDIDLPTNRFILVCDVITPFSIMFIFPIFGEDGLLNIEKVLRDTAKGVEMQTTLVSNILIGNLCYRLFDNTYSQSYTTILAEGYTIKTKLTEKIDYGNQAKLPW